MVANADVRREGPRVPPLGIPAAVVFIGGFVVMAIHHFAGNDGGAEGVSASIAFGAPCVMAGALAFIAVWKGIPQVVAGAGFAAIPIAVVSIVLWPIIFPAAWLMGAGLSASLRSRKGDTACALIVAVGLPLAFFALLVHDDPATWQTAESSGSSSDIITNTESVISFAITAAVSVIALTWMRLRSRDRGHPAGKPSVYPPIAPVSGPRRS